MHVLVSGSTGLVGSALVARLAGAGHEPVRLVRSNVRAATKELVHWEPTAGFIEAAGLEGLDAVVHLAGENIASGRWTPARKALIRESRVQGTALLCQTLAHASRPPSVLVSASAIGVYGDRGDELLTERSAAGTGFLAEVCTAWEAATEPARQRGIRVVNLRIGVVLSRAGGALARMLTPFRLGLGGVIGSGRQYMSVISLADLVEVILHVINQPACQGPVNAVCPEPVTNRQFTKALGEALSRPTLLPMPAFAARLALGEMADALLLCSARVLPEKLLAGGYAFQHATAQQALRHALGR